MAGDKMLTIIGNLVADVELTKGTEGRSGSAVACPRVKVNDELRARFQAQDA